MSTPNGELWTHKQARSALLESKDTPVSVLKSSQPILRHTGLNSDDMK